MPTNSAVLGLPRPALTVDSPDVPYWLTQLTDKLDTLAGGFVPIGGIIETAGTGSPAGGYFVDCDGRSLNSVTDTTLAPLYARIGTTHGGTGAADFRIPDTRGRTTVAPDIGTAGDAGRLTGSDTINANGGVQTVTLSGQQSGIAQHAHLITDVQHGHSVGSQDAGGGVYDESANSVVGYDNNGGSGKGIATTHTGSAFVRLIVKAAYSGITGTNNVNNTAAAQAHDNMMPYLVLNKLIRIR